MKKSILLILPVFLFSCNRDFKQQQAEVLVRDYLLKTLALPSTYHPVSYSKLDSVFPAYDQTNYAKNLRKRLEKLEFLSENKQDQDRYAREILALRKEDSIKKAAFKVQFDGWSLIHIFKGQDGTKLKEVSYKFSFDKEAKYITDVEFIE
jgi:hypothetical protein